MTQQAEKPERQERTERFKLKDVEMRFNSDGEETYDVVVYPKFRNGWSNYTREMFIWGEDPKATFDSLGKLPKECIVTLNIVSGKVKQNKQDDGRFESYFWNVVGIADGQQATPQPPQGGRRAGSASPAGTGKPQEEPAKPDWDYADIQARISWGEAVKLGVVAIGPVTQTTYASEQYLSWVESLANLLYPLIRKGPTVQEESLPAEAQASPQEATDNLFPPEEAPVQGGQPTPPETGRPGAPGTGSSGRPWIWPIRGERESEAQYFLKVAREKRGLGIGEAYAALGKPPVQPGQRMWITLWTWTLWEKEGHTLQEALDILKAMEV